MCGQRWQSRLSPRPHRTKYSQRAWTRHNSSIIQGFKVNFVPLPHWSVLDLQSLNTAAESDMETSLTIKVWPAWSEQERVTSSPMWRAPKKVTKASIMEEGCFVIRAANHTWRIPQACEHLRWHGVPDTCNSYQLCSPSLLYLSQMEIASEFRKSLGFTIKGNGRQITPNIFNWQFLKFKGQSKMHQSVSLVLAKGLHTQLGVWRTGTELLPTNMLFWYSELRPALLPYLLRFFNQPQVWGHLDRKRVGLWGELLKSLHLLVGDSICHPIINSWHMLSQK